MLKGQDVIAVLPTGFCTSRLDLFNALSPSTSFYFCEDHQEHSYCGTPVKFHHRRSAESLKGSEDNRSSPG